MSPEFHLNDENEIKKSFHILLIKEMKNFNDDQKSVLENAKKLISLYNEKKIKF